MAFEQSVIDGLIASPAESLNVELKRWIDPGQSAGQAKIIKAALGLRNRNGGYLIIGFDDQTLLPDSKSTSRYSRRLSSRYDSRVDIEPLV